MKNRILLLALASSTLSFAQISEGGLPVSFQKTLQGDYVDTSIDYQLVELQKPNMAVVLANDIQASEKGQPYQIAKNISTSLSIQNNGTWTTLSNGDKIWRLAVKIADAQALSLYFSEQVVIPEGGKLFVYNQKKTQYVGAFTANTPAFQAMELIQGDVLTLEYYMPNGQSTLPTIEISEVAYYYRGVESRIAIFRDGYIQNQTKAQSCEVDVACSEISGWEEQRDAAVHYSFSFGGGTAVCSGSVVNNTGNDCKPYILTANHCGEPTSNSNIANHIWYFNYQRPTCSVGNTNQYTGARSQTVSGGMLRASSQNGTHVANSPQVSGCDFVLVELNSNIPSSYNPYFAGWNRATSSSNSGVGIHHPAGHEKKISTYTNSLFSATYNGGWSGAHWGVVWAATTNGHGVTEGGSSGSPIFNNDGLIVGHLSGGSSLCTATSASDLYGKFNKAWEQDGNSNNSRLKPWLDPSNSGVMSLTGTYAPCNGGGNPGGNPGGGTLTSACGAASTGCDEYIENVTLNSINKTSGCDNYSDFTSISTTLQKGQSYDLAITPFANGQSGAAYTNDELSAWIDWNNDGDFSDNGEQIGYVIVAQGWNSTFNFTVPNSASAGVHRLRVRISYQPDDGAISSCGSTNWGEVEDYKIVIQGLNGISENDLQNSSIYPNPTNDLITVDLSSIEEEIFSIELKDITGRLINSKKKTDSKLVFSLSNESAGVYVVTINAKTGTYNHKVIKY